ncbi:MAG: magnesium transporter CorA family protein [Beijerinckiaceae bacterium]|nr:magnesium transporter CorA family protein [Beijerinckiaceae bacterium]
MLTFYSRENDHIVSAVLDVAPESKPLAPAGMVPWIDILNPTHAEDLFVESVIGVSIPTCEEMQEIEASSRVYSENGAEYMTINAVVNIDTDVPILSPITFVLKGQTLVTVRYSDPKPFLMFINRAKRPGASPCASGEQVMFGLLEAVIDRIADALEQAGAKIDAISHAIFKQTEKKSQSSRNNDYQQAIADIGREGERLSMFRESLISITRVLTYHNAVTDQGKKEQKEARQRLRTLQRDAASLTDHSAYLTGKVTFLLDATLGLINLEQNQIIKIFSIAAVCLMPPTLIASIYGMNFRFMPELQLEYAYPIALIAMVIAAILPFVYFKRKGWL